MGKNPNANRNKVKHHKEREYDTNIEEMQQKALELGCEVWEVEDKLRELQEAEEEGEDEQEEQKEEVKVVDFGAKLKSQAEVQ